jgi:DNA-binding MarR family transcriptional regulator
LKKKNQGENKGWWQGGTDQSKTMPAQTPEAKAILDAKIAKAKQRLAEKRTEGIPAKDRAMMDEILKPIVKKAKVDVYKHMTENEKQFVEKAVEKMDAELAPQRRKANAAKGDITSSLTDKQQKLIEKALIKFDKDVAPERRAANAKKGDITSNLTVEQKKVVDAALVKFDKEVAPERRAANAKKGDITSNLTDKQK